MEIMNDKNSIFSFSLTSEYKFQKDENFDVKKYENHKRIFEFSKYTMDNLLENFKRSKLDFVYIYEKRYNEVKIFLKVRSRLTKYWALIDITDLTLLLIKFEVFSFQKINSKEVAKLPREVIHFYKRNWIKEGIELNAGKN
uniref:Uncharacterized protein n=1 Tax=Mycoplasma anserisalpingitidis TaxID=519450 RepID=A0A8F2IV73_9MOLU|nr:hypothetical protein [Mycoplasma anserisalpingitidis]